MKGIYIIHIDTYPGIYKVGCSKNINIRFKQIQTDSNLLGNAQLLYSKEFNDYLRAEKEIHKLLAPYRVQQNREFFKADLQVIKNVIDGIDKEAFSNPYERTCRNTTELIFNWLLKNCYRKDTNEINLSALGRHRLCTELRIGNNQITNSLRKLKDSGKISGEKGTFILKGQ